MDLTANAFLEALRAFPRSEDPAATHKHYKGAAEVLGVRMKHLFDTAKRFTDMPLGEVAKLLDEPVYEARLGAVSILDFKARRKRLADEERRELYELYMGRHHRLDSWDFVDRAAPRVVGRYLLDKPRDPLYELARSSDTWERRTAVTASFWLIRQGDVDDALNLAELLLRDEEPLVHTSVGVALREIGQVDRDRLAAFLREHAGEVPAITFRYAAEKLPAALREELRAANARRT
ncbi:DNA alkylation repair protein [Glycomyces sp. A-F 0318]|uniref:DNA alkylation repair protein n=1 Tax=Glycomyces amatae TaxID=2881355 RepID=UPI001E46A32C|nr:DNA alkylation repair protein [Glycomyces amatae]MCD0445746.1 DNA alkylation repair protein [Glycomyces amatae]